MQFLSGVVTLAGLVGVVVVVVISTSPSNNSDTRRRLFSPQLLSANAGGAPGSADLFLVGKGWRGGGGGGGVGGEVFGVGVAAADRAGLGHSRRILSVDGVVEPAAVVVRGGGDGIAAGIAAAGDAAAAAGAAVGAASGFGPKLAGEPPGRERVAATTAVDGRETPR